MYFAQSVSFEIIIAHHYFTHRLGASIVVKTGTTIPFFTNNVHNPFCFIQYYDPSIPPMKWKEVFK